MDENYKYKNACQVKKKYRYFLTTAEKILMDDCYSVIRNIKEKSKPHEGSAIALNDTTNRG